MPFYSLCLSLLLLSFKCPPFFLIMTIFYIFPFFILLFCHRTFLNCNCISCVSCGMVCSLYVNKTKILILKSLTLQTPYFPLGSAFFLAHSLCAQDCICNMCYILYILRVAK